MANARVAERMAAQRKQYEEEEDKLQKQAVKQKAAAASASEKAFAQKEEAKQKAAERKAADLPSAADSSAKTSAKANSYTKTQQAQTAFETWQRDAEERRRAQQEEAKRKAAERKEADLPGYKPSGGLSTEEVKRLYNLDTEAEEERLSELKAKNIAEGGTVAAVNRGIRAGRTGTVDVDFSEAEEGRKQAEDLERDILLAKEIQRQAEWIKAQDSSEKMAEGREGYAKWEEDKKAKTEAEQKEKENESFWDFIFGAMGSSSDTTLGAQTEEAAIKAFEEDTSYKEPNDDWTYEQKRTFGYFYGKGDIKAAEEYAIEVNNAINRKKKEETLGSVTDAATRNALSEVLASAGTVAASPLSSADILTDMVENIARGTVTEKADPSVFEMSQAVREAVGEDINRKGGTLGEEWGVLSGKGFGDLYQIGMSSADSLINAYAGGKAGALINAFGGSASGAVDDALNRGADADTALRYGLATGAAELFPEYLSIDNLFRLGSAKSVGGFLKNVGSQAASEGMEGAVTAISGALADDVIMGELSKFNTEVNAYMMDGYSREEAEQMAAKGGRIDIILDAVSEAIGGGMSGAAVTGVNSAFGRNTLSEETPVPFNGNAVTEEQKLVADKIAEIENRPVSEAEKAELMEAVLEVAQEENGSAEVIAEAEKFRDFHRQKELDRATEVANRLGNVVEFDDTIVGNGIHQEDGTIIINPNSKNPVMQVLVHELTHDIETSGLYGDFSQKVLNYAAEVQGIDLAKMEQMVISDYAKAGQKLDKTLADREIVAKFAEEHLFTDEKAIERLCNTEPTLFDRIKYWISDMAAKFRGTPEERFLRDAERLYEKALATRGKITGAGVEQHNIQENMTDEERFEILKNKNIKLNASVDYSKLDAAEEKLNFISDETNFLKPNDRKKLFRKIGEEFGVFKEYQNKDVKINFMFSKGNVKESLNKQNDHYENFAKMLTCFDDVIDSAVGIEVHNRNKEKYKNDPTLKRVYVLASAFKDNAEIIPVKLEIKEFSDKNNVLYVAVALKSIKKDKVVTEGNTDNGVTQAARLSNINITNLLGKINSEDVNFLKYVPDKMLTQEQFEKKTNYKKYSTGRSFDELAKIASQEEKQQHIDAAKKYFGTTYSWNETGYITADGARLDFSGRHEGGRGGYRSVDHRDIVDALGDEYSSGEYSGGLVRFMGEGNIRLSPESGGINLSVMPTQAQLERLSDYISRERGEVILDIDDLNGNTISSTEYPKHTHANKVLADIKNYFENGILPEGSGSETAQWRYSFGRGFDEMAAEAKTPFEKGEAEGVSAEETKTPSMERAAPNLDVQDWKNLAEGIAPEFLKIWAMKDFSRFLDSAAGGNKVLRQQLFELYEKPLNEAQGTYAKNYADKVESITEKFKELGIKAGSKESAAVQRIGEGVKEIDKRGNTVPYTLNDLKTDFPDSWGNIKAGADYCREIYDEFLHDLNEMYSEIYPATVEEANARVSGYNDRIKNDREYIDRYNEVIGKLEEQKTAKQAELSRKRPNSLIYAELQNQIANIDRRIEIANRRIERIENRKLAKEISRDTLLAQIENGEILKNKQIKPRKDYFRHFQELTDEFAEIADIFSNDQRIPPNLAGKSADTKPRTIWTSIAQSRSNNNYYTEDAVGGLLRYTEIAEKLLVFDPLISHFRDVNSAIRAAGSMADNEVKKKGTNAGQFARHMDGVTNQLAGKTNPILDRAIADWGGGLGRATMKAVEVLNRRVKSNAILGNVRSALVQIGNLPNAALYIQNPVDWTMGAISLTNSTPEIIEARSKSNFMNRRYMGDTIDELTKEIQQNKLLDKLKEFALWMLGAGDKAAAELIWHTAYSQAVRNPKVLSSGKGLRGYENAVDYADDITRRSIGGRAEGDIPLAEESKIIGLVAPFQIEVANTFNAFTEQIGKKNAAGIISFEIGVWLINTVLEGIIGDRPLGLDYIDAIWDIVAEAIGDDEEEEKDFWDIVTYAGGRIAGETLSGMPLGAQIGDLITGGDEQKAEKWFGDSDPTRYGTGNIGMGALADAADYFIEGETPEEFYRLATEGGTVGEWAEPVLETVDTFAPLAMPWGGKQLSRSLRGIQQIAEGGAYGTEANGDRYLKFPQEYDPESIIKTVLFGQYASDAGQEYIDSGFSQKLSAKQTEQMEKAEALGMENGEFFDIIMGLKPYDTKEEKQKALLDMDIPVEEKNIIDAILFGGMTYKDIEGGRSVTERDYRGVEEFIVSGLDRRERILWDEDFSERDIERGMKALKDANTKEEKIEGLSEALKVEEDEAFRLLQKMEGNWIEDEKDLSEEEKVRAEGAAKLYDMSTEDFIAVLNYSKYGAQIVNEKGETEWSTKDEHVIPNVMRVTGWDEETAKKNLDIAKKYEFSRADLEEEKAVQLDTSAEWYGVEDDKFFVARNVLKTVEGEKDEYGNTVSGTYKKAAINAIKEKLGADESEATIYYLAANGDLVLSVDDLSTSHREDLKTAVERGWTERQYLDAVNVIKLSGADSKDEIIKALTDAGASYSMAQGYYNLREDKGYDTKAYFSYGMKTQKQETKGTYFIENYGNGEVTGKEISAWYAAASGCSKKQEYIDAYMSAGATFDQATKFYNLMSGHDRTFNAWYKENGG